jgi:predicted ATPase
VTVLATSREPLGVEGETVWRLGPLDEVAAECLFVDRARAHGTELEHGHYSTVREVCRALDGLPLGIELAAARATVLAPAEILTRLEDRFALLGRVGGRGGAPRQKTLRATIDWSYELLEPAEKELFRRLAVFAGPFDLAAVMALGVPNALTTLTRLVDKSLVVAHVGEPVSRYRLLDTLREYAWERLRDAGEVELARRRHLDHFLARAENLFSPNESLDGPTRELDTQLDNLRECI